MMLSLLAITASFKRFLPYIIAVAIVGLVCAVLIGTYRAGHESGVSKERMAWEKKQADAKEVARLDAEKRTEKIEKIDSAGVVKEQQNRVIYKTITKEVVRYAESPESRLCNHSAEWVRLHDSAARPGEDASPVDGTSGGATDGETIEAVTENYESCNAWRSRLIDLQDVVRASGCFVFTETGK